VVSVKSGECSLKHAHIPHSRDGRLQRHAPARRVDDNTNQATRDNTSNREGNDPAHVDPGDHAPVDRPPGTVAETNTDSGTGDTLGGRNRELELGGHDDCNCRTKLHCETTRGRVQSDAVTQVAHDVVAVRPEADNEGHTTKGTVGY